MSVRDLPYVVARGAHGATTVAATMRLAAMAGIRVFVTGGLGGVHRGAAQSFDVSADLTELGRTPVAVVCAGVKSILDIGLTLETLETLGVPVLVDGSDEFPSFYSRTSGFRRADARRRRRGDRRGPARRPWDLGLPSGSSSPTRSRSRTRSRPTRSAPSSSRRSPTWTSCGISGKDATPYLLGRIVELTDGASLTANIALVRANARLGAAIAALLARQ